MPSVWLDVAVEKACEAEAPPEVINGPADPPDPVKFEMAVALDRVKANEPFVTDGRMLPPPRLIFDV